MTPFHDPFHREDILEIPELSNFQAGPVKSNANGGKKPLVTLDQATKQHIQLVLDSVDGRIKGKGGAAEILDMNPSTLHFRMKKLGIR